MAVVLITGTSTGMGRATALLLARGGHEVWATMRNPDAALPLQTAARDEKLNLSAIRMDVDDDASVAEAFGSVLKQAGRIDVLANNAGIPGRVSVEELPLSEFRRIVETNFFGAAGRLSVPTRRRNSRSKP